MTNGEEYRETEAQRRRREDHPDWKMAAPRWLLVLLASLSLALGYRDLRQIVKRVEATASKVGSLEKRQEEGARDRALLAIQIAEVRVDSLRMQVYQLARQPGNVDFLTDVRNRLRDAERDLSRLRQEPDINGNGS